MKLNLFFYLFICAIPILCAILVFYYIRVNRTNNKQKMAFNEDIFKLAQDNNYFRKEVVTGPHSQVVLMSVAAGDDIGEEVHTVDQTLIFVQGHGQAIINGKVSEVRPNSLVFVPAGNRHNFKNIGAEPMKLFTIYAPSEHKPGTVEKIKMK